MRFPVGTQYLSHHKHPRLCTVVDYLTTTNLAGEVVRVRYVTTEEFCGQTLTDTDVVETSVAIGVDRLAKSRSYSVPS